MQSIETTDWIAYLVRRKHPVASSFSTATSLARLPRGDYLRACAEARAYREELEGMPAETLGALIEAEQEKEAEERRLAAEEAERSRHYNLPTAAADYG